MVPDGSEQSARDMYHQGTASDQSSITGRTELTSGYVPEARGGGTRIVASSFTTRKRARANDLRATPLRASFLGEKLDSRTLLLEETTTEGNRSERRERGSFQRNSRWQ